MNRIERKRREDILAMSNVERKIMFLFANKKTKEELKDILGHTIYDNEKDAKEALKIPFLNFCRMNEKKFYESTLWKMVSTFGWRISGSTLYKGMYAEDIDIFFTDKEAYDKFISFLHTAIGKDKLRYGQKKLARYKYVEDQTIIMYEWKKLDVTLTSHFQGIDEIMESNPETMDYFMDPFKGSEWEVIEEDIIDINQFNPETKSFWLPVKSKKTISHSIYKIPKNIEPPYKKYG